MGRSALSSAALEAEQEILTEYLSRPMTVAAPELLKAIESGPIDPSRVLSLDAIARLVDPAPLAVETGWCDMPDGSGYVAVRTPMPAVTAEMVDWWFDWHPHESLRYQVWHPAAHVANSVDMPAVTGAKAHWGTVHHPVEDIGTGVVNARISFLPPNQLGFVNDGLADPNVATIVCGLVGDHDRHVQHSVMAHVWLNEESGTVLRSHFWLGAVLRPDLPGLAGDMLGRLVNRRIVRQIALPDGVPQALSQHCAEEYANLAALLPELYGRFATG